MRWSARAACMLALALLAAPCAKNEDGGMAGAPAGPLALGEVCRGGLDCAAGTVCSRGAFVDQCSAQCANNAGCQLLDARGTCFVGPPKECGLSCGTAGVSCPEGTTCTSVAGGMACKLK